MLINNINQRLEQRHQINVNCILIVRVSRTRSLLARRTRKSNEFVHLDSRNRVMLDIQGPAGDVFSSSTKHLEYR